MGEWGSGVGRGEEGAGRLRGWKGKGAAREGASIKTKVNTYKNVCLPRGLEGLLLVVLYSGAPSGKYYSLSWCFVSDREGWGPIAHGGLEGFLQYRTGTVYSMIPVMYDRTPPFP